MEEREWSGYMRLVWLATIELPISLFVFQNAYFVGSGAYVATHKYLANSTTPLSHGHFRDRDYTAQSCGSKENSQRRESSMAAHVNVYLETPYLTLHQQYSLYFTNLSCLSSFHVQCTY